MGQSHNQLQTAMYFFFVSFLVGTAVSQPRSRTGQLDTRIPNTCSTLTGDKCVFPFSYQGVEYYRCTYADSPTPWCATQVDSTGVVVTNKWGDCDTGSLSSCQPETISLPSCTTQSGPYPDQACVFPFRYNGVTYTSCTTDECSSSSTTTSTTTTTTSAPAGSCTTVGGPAQGSPCVFPFNFADTTYTSCTAWIYGGQPEGTTWCSTKVDASGNHVNNEGNYGFCSADCDIPRDVSGEVFGEVFDTNARSAVVFGRQ